MSEEVGGWDEEVEQQESDYLKKAKSCAERGQPHTATAFALIDIAESLRKLNALTELKD